MDRFTMRFRRLARIAEKVLDELCREMVEKGFHVPSANYFGLMNPDTHLYGSAGGSVGGRAQSTACYLGAFPTGVEDRTRDRTLDRRARGLARRIQRNFHQRRQRSQFQRAGSGADRRNFPTRD